MSLISPDYRIMQRAYHQERPDYGVSSRKYVEQVKMLSEKLQTRDILDYGCGKCMLQKGLPFPIQNYDPCIDEWKTPPDPANIVICTDVMEHIEPHCVDAVLDDLQRLTKQLLMLDVSCRAAKKVLPDGRNAHLIQERPQWWLEKIITRFTLHSFQVGQGNFTSILFAKDFVPLLGEESA